MVSVEEPKDDEPTKQSSAMAVKREEGPAPDATITAAAEVSPDKDEDGSQQPQQQSSLAPMTNRPPSVETTQSGTSAGGSPAKLMTATSRRGGRTRSRSPSSNVARPGSSSANREGMPNEPYPDSRGNPNPQSGPANPSSAAAAAAAAAKAFSNSRGGGRDRPPPYRDERRSGDPRYHGPSENVFQGSHGWPAEEEAGEDRRGYPPPKNNEHREGGSYRQHHRYRPSHPGEPYRHPDRYGNRMPYDRDGRPYDHPSPAGHYGSDRHSRYGYRRSRRDEYYKGPGPGPGPSGMPPADARPEKGQQNPVMYRPPPEKPGTPTNMSTSHREAETPSTSKRSGGTSRVIGTATPIHVPRAADPPRQSGTPASVFRGRPGDNAPAPPADNGEDSPQKILLSLRTPTTSFEENPDARKGNKGKDDQETGDLPLSPEDPPQIQNTHQQSNDQPIFFDPQRSPSQGDGGPTVEMAPSFTLFNHSFDSLGDAHFGTPLDATFRSTSFGAGPTTSVDNADGTGPLQRNPTSGSYPSASFLEGSTFGMSPVNSFGNGPPSSSARRSGNIQFLGGENRSSSPSQMLNNAYSYSGGYGGHPSQSPPFRQRGDQPGGELVGSGSFGGPSIPHVYTPRSFGAETSPHANYPPPQYSPEVAQEPNGPPAFYIFLGRHKGAFTKCSFLLPGLKAALLETPLSDSNKTGDDKTAQQVAASIDPRGRGYPDPTPRQITIAQRRVIAAVCAFGGGITNNSERPVQIKPQLPKSENSQSIFREKEKDSTDSATVTPSSTMGTPPGKRSSARVKYEELLPTRYYENENNNRLSWEFEESPPVSNVEEETGKSGDKTADGEKVKAEPGTDEAALKTEDGEDSEAQGSSPAPPKQSQNGDDKKTEPGNKEDQPKMRYRCKLCGLPKQNHTCTYQQSLQRSIGTMSYPSVNAFTASEPGLLAPALEEMNNFVLGGESVSSGEGTPPRPTPDRKRSLTPGSASKVQVTPETLRSSPQAMSPLRSANATPQGTPYRTPGSKRKRNDSNMSGGAAISQRVGGRSPTSGDASPRKKRHHSRDNDSDLLFVEGSELKQEQFRIVTPSKSVSLPDAYTYPALPLPYAQRKRLSDNLFALSKEVPQLTDECAVVLREAREKDMWDLAVAELMTQVVVIMHCREGDSMFDGLRRYLLTLGIAC